MGDRLPCSAWASSFGRTAYDVEDAAERFRSSGIPNAEERFARWILEPPPAETVLRFEPPA